MKCWTCRKPHKRKGFIFCKKCEKKPRKSNVGTLVIYDKI